MLMTVTNLTTRTLNKLTRDDIPVYATTYGPREDPLPYPFGHVVLGPTGGGADARQLPVHPRDWNHKVVPWLTHYPSEEWNTLVQAGKISVAFAAQATRRDVEELFTAAV